MEKIKSFKELKIWQKGIEIVKDIYMLTRIFPKEELYGLTSQMKRSAISIPSNKEYSQFLHIVLGSAAELETQLIIARELEFIDKNKLDEFSEKINYLSRMVSSLLKKLK